jgi:hypothetical protein
MSVTIFISHKKEDEEKAKKVEKYIKQDYNFKTYLDVLDNEIDSTINITEHIVEKLRDATHLLVIFSEETKKSMWVPFELGVSYERNHGIGVLLWANNSMDKKELPEYLTDFPIMNSKKIPRGTGLLSQLLDDIDMREFKSDLKKYLNQIKEQEKFESITMESYGTESYKNKSDYAKVFIHELKEKLS